MDAEYEILATLWEGPQTRNGLVRSISERRDFESMPRTIYPSLQMLEDGDFVRSSPQGERRLYTLTGKGSDLLAQRAEQRESAPTESAGGDPACPVGRSMRVVRVLARAATQIARYT